jgi:hypothetical protein
MNQSSGSYSSGDSTASWDMIESPSPPSRSEYFDSFERNFTSSVTQHINSPLQHDMLDMEGPYSESSHRSVASHGQISYEPQYATTLRNHVEDHEYVNGHLSTGFCSTSPLPIGTPTLLSEHFVNPKQTFFEPFRSAPSLENCYSSHNEQLQYFISPMRTTPQPTHSEAPMSTRSAHSRGPALPAPAAMHRLQQTGRRVSKRSRTAPTEDGITRVVAGKFFCSFEGCDKGKGNAFKRQEHLKRHILTHSRDNMLMCPFCPKRFQDGRRDNLKDHLNRHARPHVKGKRTRYDPRAIDEIQRLKIAEKDGARRTRS